jgi:hypothetical protein
MRSMKTEQMFQPQNRPSGLQRARQPVRRQTGGGRTDPPLARPAPKAEDMPVRIPIAVNEMVTILRVP